MMEDLNVVIAGGAECVQPNFESIPRESRKRKQKITMTKWQTEKSGCWVNPEKIDRIEINPVLPSHVP